MNVLIVDDSRSMRMVLRQSLRLAGFDIRRAFEASDAAQALTHLRREEIDLALVDLNMPGGDGLQLLAAMARDPAMASVPAILVSAANNPQIIRRARERGAVAFLHKPFTPEDLAMVLDHAKVA